MSTTKTGCGKTTTEETGPPSEECKDCETERLAYEKADKASKGKAKGGKGKGKGDDWRDEGGVNW